jgi:uncharacterized iron-regulated protein
MTACAPHRLYGEPQNPYPQSSAPKVGDIVHLPTGNTVSLVQMLQVAADSRIVYVGETHDNPASHRLELQILQGLEERHPGKVALGLEMFSRSQQPSLDLWVAGKLDEKEFLKLARWFDNWKMDFSYYRDLLVFARERKIPVVALNAEQSMVREVRSKTLAELSAYEKSQLPAFDQTDPYQRGMAEGIFRGHNHGKMQIEDFLRAQTLWDETMAESAAHYLASPQGKGRQLLVVAGSNHVAYGFGIPRRVFRRLPTSYSMIGGQEIDIAPGVKPQMISAELPDFPMVPYHFLAYLTYEELPKVGVLLGVSFESTPSGRGLQVKEVVPLSNAKRAGLRKGDLLLFLDAEALSDGYDLVYALKRRHLGDRSTLRLERQGAPLSLEVVYQAGDQRQRDNP